MVRFELEDGAFVLQIVGEININTLSDIRNKVDSFELSQYKKIVVDLTRVNFLDSSGMGYLVVLIKQAKVNQAQISLRNPSALVKRMLSTIRLDRYVTIEGSDGLPVDAGSPGGATQQ
jgi:anti-sigma B factor antagonist